MSEPAAAVPTTEDDHVLAARRLRDFSFAQVILLVLQTVLGMRVNLFVQVPADDQGKGLLSSFGDAMSKGPAEIAAHAGFGLLVFINACLLVVFALPVRGLTVKLTSLVGWLAIAGAAVEGASFINATPDSSTANDASFTMAGLTMLAIAAYAWTLFALAKPADPEAPKPATEAEGETATEAAPEAGETEAEATTETDNETEAEATAATEVETTTDPETKPESEPEEPSK
ncbi:MAG TPA: hypothetical protein VL551_19290 [Actinospica sp.]|nr:hypothetical protein [Actinospica sp.]